MKITRYSFPIGLKIAVLADIHNTPFDISLLKNENVDLILIPGDLCTEHLSAEAYNASLPKKKNNSRVWVKPEFAVEILKVLPTIAPTYMCTGNHEFLWNDIDKSIVRESGVVLLDNEYIDFNGTIIGGISTFSRHSFANPTAPTVVCDLLSEMQKQKGKKILLLHEPQLFYSYEILKTNIDLVVSGHAHGGQWRIFGRGVFAPGQGYFPKYTKGIYDKKLLVSAGMSNTVHLIPRLFNPPELVIIK